MEVTKQISITDKEKSLDNEYLRKKPTLLLNIMIFYGEFVVKYSLGKFDQNKLIKLGKGIFNFIRQCKLIIK